MNNIKFYITLFSFFTDNLCLPEGTDCKNYNKTTIIITTTIIINDTSGIESLYFIDTKSRKALAP